MGIPKRLGSNAEKPAFRAWKTQEKNTAKRIGGTETSRSGAGDEKGDARKRNVVRVECKTTASSSFRIDFAMIKKLEDAACQSGEMPMFHIQFVDATGRPIKAVCVIPEYALDLVGQLNA